MHIKSNRYVHSRSNFFPTPFKSVFVVILRILMLLAWENSHSVSSFIYRWPGARNTWLVIIMWCAILTMWMGCRWVSHQSRWPRTVAEYDHRAYPPGHTPCSCPQEIWEHYHSHLEYQHSREHWRIRQDHRDPRLGFPELKNEACKLWLVVNRVNGPAILLVVPLLSSLCINPLAARHRA